MSKRCFSSEQIIHTLREVEVLIAYGGIAADICCQWGIAGHMFFA